MIVECPNCKTTYNFKDDQVKPEGVKARCTVCEHVFVVTPDMDQPQEEPAQEPVQEEAEAAEDSELDEAIADLDAGPEEAESETLEERVPAGPDDESPEEASEEPEGGETTGLGISLDLDDGGGKKKKEKKPKAKKGGGGGKNKLVLAVVLGLVLIVVGGGAGVYFFAPELIPGLTADKGGEQAQEEAAGETESSGRAESDERAAAPGDTAEDVIPPSVQNIVLADIRQYFVDNDKAGRIFVVEGKAVNDFETPKEDITIEVSLLDAQGAVLAAKTFPAGNSLDLYGLQNLTRDKIEEALSDEIGVTSRNKNLSRGESAPFMAVFFDPPAGVREFMVKVTGVKDPA